MTQFPFVHFVLLDSPTHEALIARAGPGTGETMSSLIRLAVRAYLGTDTQKASPGATDEALQTPQR